jgi:ribonucleoside-diphosphate reductase subunit M2
MQAASAIDTLKMTDSPAKKLDFSSADKENVFKPIVGIPDLPEEDTSVVKATIAPTIKPEEAHEPLLQENSQRFVLFPIKYHDVSLQLRFPTCLTRTSTR